jgi:DNA-binding sugar fermentation-stimulating protein
MFIPTEVVEGTFIKESKNRFLCEVLINGKIEECYVPSSSRMENYLNLKNKKVLLTINKDKNSRTRYALFAVKYFNKYILLNLNMVNDFLRNYIAFTELKEPVLDNIKKETIIEGYKTDLFIIETATTKEKIIEAKGIIDIRKNIVFPKINSERAIRQLIYIESLLNNNHRVEYYFVSLSPIIKCVTINNSYQEYYRRLNNCLSKGLKLKGISVHLCSDMKVSYKRLKIKLND